MTEPSKFTFAKPAAILKDETPGFSFDSITEEHYIQQRKAEIISALDAQQVKVRKANLSDIPAILSLSERAYDELGSKGLVSSYDYYQSITYNYGLIMYLEDYPDKIIGCFFNFAFHANGDKVCNLKRLAIDPEYQSMGLGKYLFEYNQLLAKTIYGSRVQTGLIECCNFPSLYLVLNRMGAVMDFLTDDMQPYFLCYSFVIPLDLNNWKQMEVSQEKLVSYLETLEESKDFIIFPHNDKEMMSKVCANKEFKIAAVLKAGNFREKESVVAFSNKLLNVEFRK